MLLPLEKASLLELSAALLAIPLVFLLLLFPSSRKGVTDTVSQNSRGNPRARTPPGPRGIPFFGNELQIPRDKQWLQFHEWGQQYGDIIQISIMGHPVVILGSAQVAMDLLEARGNIYSDRPTAVMAGEIVGWNRGLGYAPYGGRFKEFRKMFHQSIGPRSVHELCPLLEKGVVQFLVRLLETPTAFREHARQSTGVTILMLAYGYSAKSRNDPLVKIAEEAMLGFSKASEPGAYMVDRYPWLKYVPEWIPGSGFQAEARGMREDLERLYNVPFEFVRSQMASGCVQPSFTSKYLREKQDPSDEEKEFIKAAAASLYSGGADTTPSSVSAFILAMTLHPEVQARGQVEVDNLLKMQRLPKLSDRQSLPYVDAIVKETLRWNPAVPLGLPHRLTQDDYYRGFKLPKGATVWANIWTILHDETVFREPEAFRPERFLDDDDRPLPERATDPSVLAFGFGRRICPGLHLADSSIFLTVASILSVLEISKARDSAGNAIEPTVDFRGFISHPEPFECSIRPRSDEAGALIKRAARIAGC